jgi:uncharacterized integral membrane protein (TIGR00697 family)
MPMRSTYRYYDLILAADVCVLLCSDLIAPAKTATIHLPQLGAFTFGAGILFFPISYIFGDILTEVYGYAYDRRAVWCGFAALVFAAVMASVVVALPPSAEWLSSQDATVKMFGNTPRIVLASFVAFWCGSFVNGYVLAKMKVFTGGRWLWTRVVGSTACGQLVDSSLFYLIGFLGLWSMSQIVTIALTQYFLKSAWEVIMTPVTYRVVAFLKRAEQEDYYDSATNFTPFSLSAR